MRGGEGRSRGKTVETAAAPRLQAHFFDAITLPHKTEMFTALEEVAVLPAVKFGASGGDGEGGVNPQFLHAAKRSRIFEAKSQSKSDKRHPKRQQTAAQCEHPHA